MTLSALRTNLPLPLRLRLASLHGRAHQDGNCGFALLSRPTQLSVPADQLASNVLEDLRVADKPTEFYPLPTCRVWPYPTERSVCIRTRTRPCQ
jgi:hypothetical protein